MCGDVLLTHIVVVVLCVRPPEYYMLIGIAAHLNAGAFWW